MTTPARVKLPASAFITCDGKEREIFMSFALLNRLCFIVRDISNIPLLHLDPMMREAVLEEMLAERTKSGNVTKEVKIEEMEISLEDMESLLDFAGEHVVDFSIRVIEKATALQERNKDRLTTLQSTQVGLESSPSKNSPASPSTPPPVN